MATITTMKLEAAAPADALSKPRSGRGHFAVFCIAAIVLIVHAWSSLPFISDDALISLRYSQRLLEGHGLTWTDGPRVEGYTNLLWVLACAGLGALHLDLIVATRVLGFAGMLAALAAIVFAHWRSGRNSLLGLFVGCVGLALTGPIAVWTIGGMEQPFVAAFLAWAVAYCFEALPEVRSSTHSLLLASLFLGLLCLTRADGGVLCVAVAIGMLVANRLSAQSWRQAFTLAIFPLLMGGGQLLFRRVYYNEWLPNPARVKVAFTLDRVMSGVAYLRDANPYAGLFLLLALFGAIAGLRQPALRRCTAFLFTALLATIAYTALIGGDVFPAHRHFVPILVLAGFLAAQIAAPLKTGFVIASGLCLAALGAVQRLDPEIRRAAAERWEWDGQKVGSLLRSAFGQSDPLIACDPAGCIPYFTGFRSIDMLGLNDYHIAHHRPSDFGRGKLGHELGDGKYVLDQKPDLILWSLPTGAALPLFPSAIQMVQDPRFAQLYRLIYLRTPDPDPVMCAIWIRMDSEKVSIRRSGNDLIIPGWLAASTPEAPAMLNGQGKLAVIAQQDRAAQLPGFSPPPGRWRLSAGSNRVRLVVKPFNAKATEGIGQVIFNAAQNASVEIALFPVGQPMVQITELVLSPV